MIAPNRGTTRTPSRMRLVAIASLLIATAFLTRTLFKAKEGGPVQSLEGTPLWTALLAEGFARSDEAYGRVVDGARFNWPSTARPLLVPETVVVEGLEIGRFEVTRAQWAAFRSAGPASEVIELTERTELTENLPIVGVSFEDALAYCEWLSRTAGGHWRLPTEKEFLALVQTAEWPGDRGENTLERWVGGAPSPDEAATLVALAEKVLTRRADDTSPLLLPVGSCPPALFGPRGSRLALFDLGGNAAEWVVVPQEAEASMKATGATDVARLQGKAIGGCALLAANAGHEDRAPPPAAVGLRVVRERP